MMRQEDVNDMVNFGVAVAALGFVGYMMRIATRTMLPETADRPQWTLPETEKIAVVCPICGREIKVPDYDYRKMTKSDALKRHIEREHTSRVRMHPQAALIEGGEPVPPQYRDLVGLISDPLPEYSLAILPAVEAEEKERKVDAVLRQLKDGVEGIQDSYQFRLFLSTMAKFHDYSIGNQILIMLQRPEATRVAGFNTWKDLGRWVQKGEKGIAILAPIMPPKPKAQEKQPEAEELEEIEPRPVYFKVVYVFDLSQTEGRELPEFDVPVLTGEANEQLFEDLLTLAGRKGLTVSFDPAPHQDPSVKGYYSGKSIWVRPEESSAQQLKTLIHEMAHYFSEEVFRIPRADAETIAESAAFVVGAHFGFDSGVRSFPYVALWAKDKKALDQNLNAIRRVAGTILDKLEEIRARIPV